MAENEEKRPEDDVQSRFPDLPPPPDVPEAPKLSPKLPTHPERKTTGVEPGGNRKLAIATTAASSFIMPIIVLSVGGWWLDQKMHHTTYWFAFLGVIVGMVVGVVSLLHVIKRLSE